MGSRDHYVSQFFLKQFTDPESTGSSDPWLWFGDIAQGTVKRRAPRNIGWSRDLFSGPGALADRQRTLENHLAQQVEGPAALALRSFVSVPIGQIHALPSELSRYLSWLAARSLSMKSLYESWANELGPAFSEELAEEPPPGIRDMAAAPDRQHTMEHPHHGVRTDVSGSEIELLMASGWRWHLGHADFLEMVHMQAWYFQARFFPRFRWKILDAPSGKSFITCDRPALWGFDGNWEVPPAALRHRRAEFIVPISRSRAVFAHNPDHDRLDPISPERINQVVGRSAHAWIAGSSEKLVKHALSELSSEIH